MKRAALLLGFVAIPLLAASPRDAAEAWRRAHEQAILDEFQQLLALPNIASDAPNIERNASALLAMMRKRGIDAKLVRLEGVPPLVVGTLAGAKAKPTIAFYAHYDGQPVDPAQWSSPPFTPVIREVNGEPRIFARSASDDKAPIEAMLAALDALREAKIAPQTTLKFVFEGEEEAGSAHLPQYLERFPNELAADAWLLCDGPVHQSRKMQLYFGARGVTDLNITVYGPLRPLHSGHYGNWAPNPIVELTHLIDGMRDENAHILIEHFYDDVAPLTAAERDAIAAVPPADEQLRQELALGRTEGGKPLVEQIHAPALNLRGISGGHVGAQSANAISTEATASIDFRLVPNQTPERVRALVEAHLAKNGWLVVHETPDAVVRRAHAKVAKLEWGSGGYIAARTPIDASFSRQVSEVVQRAVGYAPVRLPSLGGSIPMYLFTNGGKTPVVGLPIVNHDNNQHGANENLRLANLWMGIDVFAELFAGLK